MSFQLDDYIDVAERIVEFREKHPDGSLQQLSVEFRQFADTSWVIYTAAAYRTPDDTRPGHGTAWEAVPGKTPYTRGSELQNAETSAWGRAIVAALAADTKRGIASAQDVRNRNAEREAPPEPSLKMRVWDASKHAWPAHTDEARKEVIRKELADIMRLESLSEDDAVRALLADWGEKSD